MSEEVKEKSTWWIHVDLTTIFIIVVLCVGGLVAKWEYEKQYRNEVIAAEKAKAERDAREQVAIVEQQRRDKLASEELDIRSKEFIELQKSKLAERERSKQQSEQQQAERRTLQIANETARQEQYELERKRQLDDVAAARARQELERKINSSRPGVTSVTNPGDPGFDKDSFIAAARTDLAVASKEMDELQRKLDPMQSKTIAYQNKLNGAQKTAAMLKQQLENAQGEHGTGLAAGGGYSTRTVQDANGNLSTRTAVGNTGSGALVNNRAEEIAKLKPKLDAANREIADTKAGLAGSQADRDAINKGLEDAKLRRENAIKALKLVGADVAPAKPAAAVAEAPVAAPKTNEQPVAPPPAPSAANPTYVLKDGRRIVVTKAVDAGDSWSVKTEAGKFIVIQKDDVEKIEK